MQIDLQAGSAITDDLADRHADETNDGIGCALAIAVCRLVGCRTISDEVNDRHEEGDGVRLTDDSLEIGG